MPSRARQDSTLTLQEEGKEKEEVDVAVPRRVVELSFRDGSTSKPPSSG